jgi:5-(carboxyamino)imidazole ribonucleotide mutase
LSDRHAKLFGDHLVGVAERPTQASLERATDRRFAGSHESDEYNRSRRRRHRGNLAAACTLAMPLQLHEWVFHSSPRRMADQYSQSALVAVVMGSASDWETMRHCVDLLGELGVPHEHRIISAHRTPELMAQFAREAADRGVRVIVAGAGGAAHLPGMIAAHTWLPVLGVPVQSHALQGVDSLLSIAQMPAGVPVGTLAIGVSGAKNAALLAASIVALHDESIRAKVKDFRQRQTDAVLAQRVP